MASACEEKYASMTKEVGDDEAAGIVFDALQSALGEKAKPSDARAAAFTNKLRTIAAREERKHHA